MWSLAKRGKHSARDAFGSFRSSCGLERSQALDQTRRDDVVLVDLSALVFKMQATQNGSQSPSSSRMLAHIENWTGKLLSERMPRFGALVLDSRDASSSRQDLIESSAQSSAQTPVFEYKGDRVKEKSPHVSETFHQLHQTQSLHGMPIMKVASTEADDVISTLTRKFLGARLSVAILSPDKDFLQLLDDPVDEGDHTQRVKLVRSFRFPCRDIVDGVWFREHFGGLVPSQFADYLALVGDQSDSVPGVKGCGKVSATKLLLKYGSLDNILDAALRGEIAGRLGRELVECANLAKLCKQLVLLNDNIALDVDPISHFRLARKE